MTITNPFAKAAHLRFRPRLDHRLAAQTGDPWSPQQTAQLDDKRILSERKLLELLASDDPSKRALALNAFNDFSQRFGDLVLYALSATNMFPSQQTQGIPAAVTLGDAERQMVDLRWTALYDVQDYRQQTHPFFKIVDLYHAITFRAYQMGERVEMGVVEAAEAIFEAEIIAGGLQWNQLWSEWQAVWSQQRGLSAMQTRYANQLAKTAYEVITAAGLSVTAYDATGTTTLEKDINTINAAALAIRTALYNAAAPKTGQVTEEIVGGSEPYWLLYNDLTAGYEDRIMKAIDARLDMPNDNLSVGHLLRPIVPLGSPYVPTGAWYMTIGGRKNVAAIFRDLRMFDISDPRIAGVMQGRVGQGAYKLVRGSALQARQVAVSA